MRLAAYDPDVIRERLERSGAEIHVYGEIDSTNRLARARALAGAPTGSLVVAEWQRRGRGRDGRSWHSPAGAGLWMTSISRAPVPATTGGLVPLVAGLAVASALEASRDVRIALKWPNDVIGGGRKLGGILVESATAGGVLAWTIVGVGLNLAGELPEELHGIGVTLSELDTGAIDRHALLVDVHRSLLAGVERLAREGGAWVRPAFAARDALRDARVVLATGDGARLEGIARGVDADGALLVETGEGRTPVRSASVLEWSPGRGMAGS